MSRPGSSADTLKVAGDGHVAHEGASGSKGIMDHEAFNVKPLSIGNGELLDTLYYPDEYTLKPAIPGELDRERLATTFTLGFPAMQRQSFCFVSPSVIAFPSGNAVSLLNIVTMEQQLLIGPRCGGIVAVAVHPDTTFLAVAERHTQGPNVYIYSYPELRLYRVLRGGADLSFSQLTFSQADGGIYLASAASDPDYTLTVWDWRKERVVLRAKAFSQDLFHVAFSPINPLAIITSGVGHIKFWKMASTFTGLKLQGLLGKFGATELTDIPCFIVLPSGKVLSATDSGILLLWDGNFIQCEVSGRLGKKCHQGAIEFIALDDGDVITAGEDGFIRTWDLEAIEGPAPTEGKSPTATTVFELEPLDELFVGKDVKIKCMRQTPVDSTTAKANKAAATAAAAGVDYIAADSNGALWRINLKARTSERIWSFPSGPIHAIDTCTSAVHHLVVSAGHDGTIRVNDPLTRSPLAIARHPVPATCIKYLPRSLDVLGCSLVAGFADGSIRFFRHGVPTPNKSSITIARTHALRPHASAVVSLVLSSDATVLATANEQGDVFFFLVRNVGVTFDRTTTVTPVGFLSLGTPIRSLVWGLDPQAKSTSNRIRGRYLAVAKSGEALILTINLDKQYERDHNFVIPVADYDVAPWSLQKYGDAAVAVPSAVSVSAGDRPTTAGGGAKSHLGADDPGESGRDAQPSAESKDPNTTALTDPPPVKHQVTQALYFEQDHFVCAIESSNGTTELRSCLLGDAKISRLLLTLHNHASITHLGISPTLKALLVGCNDGTVYYRPISFDGDLNLSNTGGHESLLLSEEYFWRTHAHAGSVVGFRATFDDAIFVAAGADGSIFVIKSAVDDLVQRALSTDGMVLPALEDADDLPNKYTIQEAKMMLRIDEENTLADQRKLARKSIVRDLQRQLDAIRSENAMLPAALQLPEDALHVDPQLKSRIAEETAAKVAKAKNQLLWQSEKISLLLRKLKQRFHDPVASYVVTVDGFQNGLTLSSFRTEKIEMQDLKPMTAQAQHHLKPGQQLGPASHGDSEKHKQVIISQGNGATFQQSPSAGVPKSNGTEGKADTTKQVSAKAQARVDQNARLEDRRRIKNERIEQWKQLMAGKPSPTSEDPRDAAAIRYAETHMGDYKLKRDKNYIVPENERVNAEIKHKQIALLQASLVRIMEAFNGKVQALLNRKQQLSQEIEGRNSQLAAAQSALATFGSAARRNMSVITSTEVSQEHLSSQDQLERTAHIQRLEHYITRLNKANANAIVQFDSVLATLCRERLSITTDVKSGEIRLLLLFQEWKLLKEFEKHDTRLSEKLSTKKTEKAEIDLKIQDIQAKIVEKRNEIERAMDARKSLEVKLSETIGESSKFEEILVKVFRKKIKRRRRKEHQAQQEGNEEVTEGNAPEEEEEEEEESEDESDSDEDSGDEAVSDDCPQGCDAAIHKTVLALREKRLDLEESLADVQKSVDALKKDHDIFSKKEKVISAALRQTEQEIQEFQSQKQKKLNELDVVVPLAFHQIQYFEDNLEDALVFPHDGLDCLRHRIVETEEETQQVHKDHKELKREHISLLSIRKEKRVKLAEFEAKCTEVQMLKFGRIVDLDRLEKMGINKAAEDLRVQIAEKERQQARQLEAWDHRITDLKKMLTAAVVENTKQLEAIYELSMKRKALEQALDTEQTAVLSQYGGPSRQEIEEQNRLISTVQRQAQEIEELKIELTDLLRKPGPVVPPILPKGKNHGTKMPTVGSALLPPLLREQPQALAPAPMVDSRTSSA